ncbi:peritrophin-55-like [Pungitius pungitius]|uniref:peritrophin-55-like n=1 Tax=Pungitius pungitius TaxID=134920 RepID=UPI002E1669F9
MEGDQPPKSRTAHPHRVKMGKLTLTAGLCLIFASLGVPGHARHLGGYKVGYGNPCYGRQDGKYPNPNDPHSFYNCVWGHTYVQKCPKNLVYKHSITTCYYPGSSETSSTSDETTTSPPTAAPMTTTSPHTAAPMTTTSPPTAAPMTTTSPPTAAPMTTTNPPTAAPMTTTSPPTAAPMNTTSPPTTSSHDHHQSSHDHH